MIVREQKTLERELAPFHKINNHFPKYLLTLDPEEPAYDGMTGKHNKLAIKFIKHFS